LRIDSGYSIDFGGGKSADSEGAGLGLAIVQEIMKAHGGTVTLDDNLQGGTIFTLCFAARCGKQET